MVRLIARKRSTPCYGPIPGRSSYTPLRSAGRHRARGLAGQRSSTAEPPPRKIFRRLADEIIGAIGESTSITIVVRRSPRRRSALSRAPSQASAIRNRGRSPGSRHPTPTMAAEPSFGHQEVRQRLRDLPKAQLGSAAIVGVGWRLPGERPRLRIAEACDGAQQSADRRRGDRRTTIVIEVLSPIAPTISSASRRNISRGGVRQYWIVDPRDRVLDVFQQSATGWERIAQLSARSTACYACLLYTSDAADEEDR